MKPVKTFLIMVAITCIVTACASGRYASERLTIVQSLYDGYANSPSKDIRPPSVPKNLFTQSFKELLDKDDEMSKNGIACIDYDYIIQGQDYDEKEIAGTIKLDAQRDGRVKVTFTNFESPTTLYYVFSCEKGKCLIDDIIEPTGSFKKGLNECLERLKKTE